MKLITIKTSADMRGANLVEVKFSQGGKNIIVKRGNDVVVNENNVQVVLSDNELIMFEPERFVPIKVRACFDDGTEIDSNLMYRPINTTRGDYAVNANYGGVNILINNTEADRLWDELDDKVDKVEGKGLSTNDYTAADKTKLSGIETGAEVNVQPDWNEANTGNDDYIKNKPSMLTTAEIDAIVNSLS